MQVHPTIASLRAALKSVAPVALVPTMGNLHEGHMALVDEAFKKSGQVVVSIFVNRLQFGQGEDFDRYPRTFERDLSLLKDAGVAHVFAPTEAEMYPEPQQYHVEPPEAQASILEGAFRPGHFRGVATVVLKLFNIVQPDFALFGKKDYQQLMVIRNMVRELSLPIDLIAVETIRARDGLALSSRNSYLSDQERAEAPRLYCVLDHICKSIRAGKRNFSELETEAIQHLKQYGWQPDYIAVRRQRDLQLPEDDKDKLIVLAAARLGGARLIDNLEI